MTSRRHQRRLAFWRGSFPAIAIPMALMLLSAFADSLTQ